MSVCFFVLNFTKKSRGVVTSLIKTVTKMIVQPRFPTLDLIQLMSVTHKSLGAVTAERSENKFIVSPYIKYLYFFFGLTGTGSVPPAERGLHLINLLAVSFEPIKNPHSAKASPA